MKEGWKYVKLGEIAVIKGGKRVPKGKALSTIPTAHKYIRVADFNDNGSVDMDDIHYVSDDVYEQIKRYTITSDDVYVSIAGTIGKTGIIPKELDGANLTENACKLQLSEVVDKRFVYYFTLSPTFKSQIAVSTKVSAQPKLALTRLAEVQISIPPLSEQQSIVAHFDASFAEIDALKAKAAEEVANAKAMFDAALREEMTSKEGTPLKQIGEIFKSYSGGTPIKSNKDYYENGDIPWLRSGEVGQKYITKTEMFITEAGLKNSSAKYYPENTVVIAMYGATAAQVGILKIEATSNQAVCGLLPNEKYIPEYVYYWFSSIQKDLAAQAQGGAQPNISQEKIKRVLIPEIDIQVQQRIVAKLDTLRSHLTELEQKYNLIAANCDALKQAILRETFE